MYSWHQQECNLTRQAGLGAQPQLLMTRLDSLTACGAKPIENSTHGFAWHKGMQKANEPS